MDKLIGMKIISLLLLLWFGAAGAFSYWEIHLPLDERGARACTSDWGFFGHRRINRLAIFALPEEMLGFYKKHIEFITDHAVDPDKRRYATKHEAVRHYIDLDHWGTFPFDNVPRNWSAALAQYSDVYVVDEHLDTLLLIGYPTLEGRTEKPLIYTGGEYLQLVEGLVDIVPTQEYIRFFNQYIMPQYYEEEWLLDCAVLDNLLGTHHLDFSCQSVFVIDRFSGTGIVPYHLKKAFGDLVEAFRQKNTLRILRLSSDFGHYIGDAHVPLHTTKNYNGQLTDQIGIHAFWESRIPELFADKEYDYFVGKAILVDDIQDYCWDIVLTSHSYVDSVLLIEKKLRRTFPADQQYCFDNRNNQTVRIQCEAFARAYAERMHGMVETRMRASILSVASLWYSAWVQAGSPDINELDLFAADEGSLKEVEKEEELYKKKSGREKWGRGH